VQTYLSNFINAHWEEEHNPLEPANIHEDFVFDDGVKKWGIDRILTEASVKNRTQEGRIIYLIPGDSLERFFYETFVSVSYGEGFKGEDGVDLSFSTAEKISFGVVELREGKVVLHQQRE
jgi:hypothetical protein